MKMSFNNFMLTQQQARFSFFAAIKKLAPKVLSSLKNNVFPQFQLLLDSGFTFEPSQTAFELENAIKIFPRHTLECDLSNYDTKHHNYIQFEHAICKWAEESNLVDVWCIQTALETLFYWRENGVSNDWTHESKMLDEDERLTFTFQLWQIEADIWTNYKDRVTTEFVAFLENYEKQVREAANENGVFTIKSKKNSNKHHFDWLVEFQINCKGYEQIAKSVQLGGRSNTPSNTIHDAIRSTSAVLGLTLRNIKRTN